MVVPIDDLSLKEMTIETHYTIPVRTGAIILPILADHVIK
jgi:hypothetical protein